VAALVRRGGSRLHESLTNLARMEVGQSNPGRAPWQAVERYAQQPDPLPERPPYAVEERARRFRFRLGCALFTAVAAVPAAVQDVGSYIRAVEGPQHPDRGGVDALTLDELLEYFHVPGVGLAVISDFRIHWVASYGTADALTGARVDEHSLFQAASISKPVTAMAVLKAAQDGRLSMDGDINAALRTWRLPDGPLTAQRKVTARTLAAHVSGLGDGLGFPGYEPGAPLPTMSQILDGLPPSNVGPVRMARAPLVAMRYSGGGYMLLQLALSDALGRPFPQILSESVLEPLGMLHSRFEQPLSPDRDQRATRAHDSSGRPMGSKYHVYPELAAAGLWTTPEDLAKFVLEIQASAHGSANRVLSRESASEMLRPIGVGDYAVGLSVERRGQGWYFQHWGGNWGYVCHLSGHVAKGYGLVVMTNGEKGKPLVNEIRERIERAYGWDSLDKPAR
jgi:CubicO group peptidase (beta-lactamase class C family)